MELRLPRWAAGKGTESPKCLRPPPLPLSCPSCSLPSSSHISERLVSFVVHRERKGFEARIHGSSLRFIDEGIQVTARRRKRIQRIQIAGSQRVRHGGRNLDWLPGLLFPFEGDGNHESRRWRRRRDHGDSLRYAGFLFPKIWDGDLLLLSLPRMRRRGLPLLRHGR
ncbi:hypothetical protein BHM03_00001341 [Ensete ventricosum]|uniref:Uncharacterized protein n=1 Tax=Ensete ventricosum TaxID=4639 RepID=A0A445M938_ENSVE|nr:hypothetical protein BHM03_00001341 [Ensete ventricosum]